VIILKSAQRSHVTPNATGLMLQYMLNLPSDPTFPGLGLRRVQWMCYNGNARSAALAQRLGFHMEGTLRWLLVCVEGSPIGDEARPGDPVRDGVGMISCTVCAGTTGRAMGGLLLKSRWLDVYSPLDQYPAPLALDMHTSHLRHVSRIGLFLFHRHVRLRRAIRVHPDAECVRRGKRAPL
jgi:hypothetical protein